MKGVNIITAFSSNVILRLLFIYPCLKVPAMSEAKSVPPGSEECAAGERRVCRGAERRARRCASEARERDVRHSTSYRFASLQPSLLFQPHLGVLNVKQL